MGYLVINLPEGDVLLGDKNSYARDHNLPHVAKDGRSVTAEHLKREEESGLGA